ncbi:MAG: ABC transporter substrate-binding protein [Myxococcales bacterium]|nr:ABC transporter substrate-binding protein [Myxococcales bacterium]
MSDDALGLRISRRSALASAVGLASSSALGACARPVDPRVLRVGHLFNITHGAGLCALESGRLAGALGGVTVESKAFTAGPAVIEALLGGAIDVAYAGAPPVLAAWLRSRGTAVRLLAGACSGGAGLVVRPGLEFVGPRSLDGRTVVTPQLGNTQDVALRDYLRRHGMSPSESGGSVRVLPLSNAECFNQFRLGRVDAAWVAEPTLSRIIVEARGVLAIDERDLWPVRRFVTALFVARADYMDRARDNVLRALEVHRDEVRRLARSDGASRALVASSLARALGRPLPARVLEGGFSRCDFTDDPLLDSLRAQGRASQSLGFLPEGALESLSPSVR